jgi:hypothetical protein
MRTRDRARRPDFGFTPSAQRPWHALQPRCTKINARGSPCRSPRGPLVGLCARAPLPITSAAPMPSIMRFIFASPLRELEASLSAGRGGIGEGGMKRPSPAVQISLAIWTRHLPDNSNRESAMTMKRGDPRHHAGYRPWNDAVSLAKARSPSAKSGLSAMRARCRSSSSRWVAVAIHESAISQRSFPVHLGPFALPNRVVMAPMSQRRAAGLAMAGVPELAPSLSRQVNTNTCCGAASAG